MKFNIMVKNLFRLSDGITVIACSGGRGDGVLAGRIATLAVDGEMRQKFLVEGERRMLNQTKEGERAIETRDDILLTQDEAQSGRFTLNFD